MGDVETRTLGSEWAGRAAGILQILGGGLEATGGIGLLLVPEPTFLTKAGGVILIGHSADSISAGLKSIWYGATQETLTQQAAASAARHAGASDRVAQRIGTAVDIAAGVGPSVATQAVRELAIRAGQTATDRVAIAWFSPGAWRFGHNAVGVGRAQETFWFHLAGDIRQPGGVRFAVRTQPNPLYQITELAVPATRAARALRASEGLVKQGQQTWRLLGPNCSTTALQVLQEGGIAVPAWARAPAALHFGVRHGYAITAIGSASAGGVAGVTAQRQ
jgi:hypothetical protein